MEISTIRELQAYGFIIFIIVLCFILYGYLYHLYKNQRSGKKDYEKYSNLALDDEINDKVVDPISDGALKANKES